MATAYQTSSHAVALHYYVAFYNGKNHTFQAASMGDAKKQAIEFFKVPKSKSKQGLIAIELLSEIEDISATCY